MSGFDDISEEYAIFKFSCDTRVGSDSFDVDKMGAMKLTASLGEYFFVHCEIYRSDVVHYLTVRSLRFFTLSHCFKRVIFVLVL